MAVHDTECIAMMPVSLQVDGAHRLSLVRRRDSWRAMKGPGERDQEDQERQ